MPPSLSNEHGCFWVLRWDKVGSKGGWGRKGVGGGRGELYKGEANACLSKKKRGTSRYEVWRSSYLSFFPRQVILLLFPLPLSCAIPYIPHDLPSCAIPYSFGKLPPSTFPHRLQNGHRPALLPREPWRKRKIWTRGEYICRDVFCIIREILLGIFLPRLRLASIHR
jgi:hypothetical protein